MTLAGWAVRNLGRSKLRTTLTVIAVGISMLAFIFLRTVLSAWASGAEGGTGNHVMTRSKISLLMKLPLRYVAEIRKVPHVTAATNFVWFAGKVPGHNEEFFPSFLTDPPTFFEVFQGELRIPEDQKQNFIKARQGAIVGERIAAKWGWKVGDRVVLDSAAFPASGEPWTFTIEGIFTPITKTTTPDTVIISYGYVNAALPSVLKDQAGWVVSRVDNGALAAEVARNIDARFDSNDLQTLSQDEKSFARNFMGEIGTVFTALNVVSLVLLGILLLILGNTIAMTARERTNEFGVMRALGFSKGVIVGFILSESVLIALLGSTLGVALAIPAIDFVIGPQVESNFSEAFPYFRIPATAFVLVFAAGAAIALLAAALPARGAIRLRTVDAIRKVG